MLEVRRLCLRLCGLALFTACGDSTTQPVAVATVEVTAGTPGVVIGHTVQLTAVVKDATGHELTGRVVTWTSSAPAFAPVSQGGMASGMALADGVVITATSEGKSGSVTLAVVPDVSGEWTFTEQFSGDDFLGRSVTCSDTGAYRFSQDGPNISGTMTQVGTCLGSLHSFDNALLSNTTVTDGHLTATHISFTALDCTREATLAVSPAPKLTGQMSCGGWTGTWEATLGGAPVTSVEVRWDVQTLVGGVVQLVAVPRDAAGHPLGRPVTWSSDNIAVATVSDNGLVSTLTAGSAHITATSEGKTGSATVTADLVSFASVSAGWYDSCALTTTGAAYCWGWGGNGQLGTGFRAAVRAPLASAEAPRAVAGGHTFAMVAAGYGRACGVTTDGEAYCWGDNTSGQLGDGSNASSLAPVLVAGGQPFTRVTLGAYHACGVTTSNAVYCWGRNGEGQLGDGSGTGSSSPVLVAGDLSFQSVRAGSYHTCGVTTDNAAYCWGWDDYGQVGDGTYTHAVLSPVVVSSDSSFGSVAAGYNHSCAMSLAGAAFCWGSGDLIGDGTGNSQAAPVPVAGGLTFATTGAALSAGQENTCVLTPAGAAQCWGHNDVGQLGDGSLTDRLTPVGVSGGLTFASVSVGLYHSCGVTTDAVAYCWGIGADGQLGSTPAQSCMVDGTAYPCSTAPLRVSGTVQVGPTVARVPGIDAQARAAPSPPTLRRVMFGPGVRGPAPKVLTKKR
jgi:alpha-tubulin suppressor-like RCC1 family protein